MDDSFSAALRVLHVDDEAEVADLTATYLEQENEDFRVETETDPSAARDRLGDGDFDCVISDYDMPEQDGIEFLQAVRVDFPDLPFILYTGKGSEEIASEAVSAGVTDYLQKGSGADQYTVLANRVRNAVEQYRSRRALEASRDRLTLLFEESPIGIIEWDESFEVVRANETAADIFGSEPGDLVGRSWETLVPESDRDSVGELLADLRAAEGGYHSVDENVRKDGERIVCEWHNRLVTDDDGSVIAIFSQFRDVTDRREREREMAFFTELVETVGVGVAVYGADGRYEYVNDAYAAMLETDRETLTDTALWAVNPDLTPERFDNYWASFEPGTTRIDETVHSLGAVSVPVQTVTTCREIDGTRYHFGTITDITDRKEREREIQRQNDRLSEFANIVSHDLRNPLQVASGAVQMAQRECDSDHLDDAARAHERMSALISDLLTLAREGDRVLERVAVDLDALAGDCWTTVETGAATLAVATDRTVSADEASLRQLLENLFRNAVEHGSTSPPSQAPEDADGASSVEHGDRSVTVTVGACDDGFYVADDGPGIPEDERADVFESGYSTADDGTGFGLSIVEEIAAAHGWDVRVTDSEAGGARFEFTGVEFAS